MSESCNCECGPSVCIGSSVGGCCLFIFILIMSSIGVVQFNEIAFLKAWGQSIDQTEVYTQGRYFVGFTNSFVTFPATVINLNLQDLEVFSSNEGDDAGTTLEIDVSVQYVLDPERLSDLFDIGGETGFTTQIQAEAIETLKNAAPQFNADAYLTDRAAIETNFKTLLQERIALNFANTQVVNVQLLRVPFPASFYQRKLDVGLQALKNEIENFTRETVQVRDETAKKVLLIENDAREIVEKADSQAGLIVARAENEFERVIGSANEVAMNRLAEALDITPDSPTYQADFLSLNYLIQLLNNQGTQKKFVNFGQLPAATSLVT